MKRESKKLLDKPGEVEIYIEPHHKRDNYYWVTAVHNGRTVLLGAFSTEEEADRIGYRKISGHYDVIMLPTKDSGKASQLIKARKLHNSANLEDSMQRLRHQI